MVSKMYTSESEIMYERFYISSLLKLVSPGYSIHFFPCAGNAEKHILKKSMKVLQERTCIKFIEMEPTSEVNGHYVHFISTIEKR